MKLKGCEGIIMSGGKFFYSFFYHSFFSIFFCKFIVFYRGSCWKLNYLQWKKGLLSMGSYWCLLCIFLNVCSKITVKKNIGFYFKYICSSDVFLFCIMKYYKKTLLNLKISSCKFHCQNWRKGIILPFLMDVILCKCSHT